MNKFVKGQKLSTRSIGDSGCVFEGEVMGRTSKTITLKTRMDGTKRAKIHHDSEGHEFVFPFGRYSMAPIFRAPVQG